MSAEDPAQPRPCAARGRRGRRRGRDHASHA